MLRLVLRRLGGPPRRVAVAKELVTLGRSARADIHLDDLYASRLHAELRREGGRFHLRDLDSANGTTVNGARIRGEVELGPGDRIQIGGTTVDIDDRPSTAGRSNGASAVSDPDSPSRVFAAPPLRARVEGEDSRVSTTFAALLASARAAGAELPRESDLDRRRDLFAVLAKVGVALLSTADLDQVLQQILDFVFEGVPAERAFLLLAERDGRLVCRAASQRAPGGATGGAVPGDALRPSGLRSASNPPAPSPAADPAAAASGNLAGSLREVRISQAVIEEVIGAGRPVLTSDALTDARFRDRDSIVLDNVRSVMAVPLAAAGSRIGLIYVDSPVRASVFSRDDLSLLSTIASVAAIKIDNTRLVEERLENERIRTQLASAREIQSRLLPADPPTLEGYDLAGLSFPSLEVGGDYYDFIPLGDGRCLVAFGDVTGKGIDAALVMSSLHAAVRAQAETGAGPATIVTRVNRYLEDTVPYNRFVTLFCGILDPARHELSYANAGHNPPLLVRATTPSHQAPTAWGLGRLVADGDEAAAAALEVIALEATGPPLGVDADSLYPLSTATFGPADVLVGYSDGVVEAADQQGEEFGTDRLVELVRRHLDLDAGRLSSEIDAALEAFLSGRAAPDDVTVVIVKRLAGATATPTAAP